MALFVYTSRPRTLLGAIKQAIGEKKIDTWVCDSDGDFTHVPPQWRRKAWFRPFVSDGVLQLGLLGQSNTTMTKVVYGVYHGRFAEMLLMHFDTSFANVVSTALPKASLDSFKVA
jgi:hypothetical protein